MTYHHFTLEALREARERIVAGWVQGDGYEIHEGRIVGYCAAMAVMRDESSRWRHAVNALHDTIREQYPEGQWGRAFSTIVAWNDAPERTKDEVLAVYDKTIARLEEQV